MKIESWIFGSGVFFFVPVALVYGFLTSWGEWVGILGILLVLGWVTLKGYWPYLWNEWLTSVDQNRNGVMYLVLALLMMLRGFAGKRVGLRPEDRSDAEIHEGAGEQGHFSPWSWWPLVLGIACATGFLGLAVGTWIIFIAGGLAVVALVGWVYEYSRGDHAH